MLVSTKDMLVKAQKEHYAVANFCIWNVEMLSGVIHTQIQRIKNGMPGGPACRYIYRAALSWYFCILICSPVYECLIK